MNSPALRFIVGSTALFRGLGILVSSWRLVSLALVPFVFGSFFLILGFYFGLTHMSTWVDTFIELLPNSIGSYYHTMHWLGLVLFFPVFLLFLGYLSIIIIRIFAGPFHALIAERILEERGVIRALPFSLIPWVRLNLRLLGVSLLRAILFLILSFALLLIALIPGFNVFSLLGFSVLVAFDSVDYSFELLHLGFRQRLKYFIRHFSIFSGYSITLGLIFWIPGLNLLMFSVAVAAGAELIVKIETNERLKVVHGTGSSS